MGFWIFMLVMNLLIPAVMILFGRRFLKDPPQNINTLYGYRTARSKASPEAWAFAHEVCGKIWLRAGILLLPISVVAMLPLLGRNTESISIWATVLCFIQVAVMLLTLLPVERALKKNFDAWGNPFKE